MRWSDDAGHLGLVEDCERLLPSLAAPTETRDVDAHRRRTGRHGPREVPVELAAGAPINDKSGSQHSPQPNPLAQLLLHGHNSKT